MADELRQAEVEDLDLPIAREHQVRGLDVAVDDPGAMGFGQSLCHLDGNVERVIDGKWSAPDALRQRLAFVVGHDEIELPVVGFADVVDGADIRMVQGRGRLGFLDESLFRRLVARQLGRKKLERGEAVEAGVPDLIDETHAASAEMGDDLVGTNT